MTADPPRRKGRVAKAPQSKILGELLATPTLMLALPTERSVAEFIARAIGHLPGIDACRVCLECATSGGDTPEWEECRGCPGAGVDGFPADGLVPDTHCLLEGRPDTRVLRLTAGGGLRGFVASRVRDAEGYAPYDPFVANIGGFLALDLENREHKARLGRVNEALQQDVTERRRIEGELLRHQESLEERVAARTAELGRLNEGLRKEIREREAAEAEVRRGHRALVVLSECNQAMIRAVDEGELLATICRLVVEKGHYEAAWIGFTEREARGTLAPVAYAGLDPAGARMAGGAWVDPLDPRSPARRAVGTGRASLAQRPGGTREPAGRAESVGVGELEIWLGLPLEVDGEIIGALSIGSSRSEAFDAAELGLLEELAADLAFGISTLRSRVAHARAEADLLMFRHLVDHANDAIFLVDLPSARFLDVNEGATRLLGYTREEFLGMAIPDVDAAFRDPATLEAAIRARRDAGATTMVRRHLHRDGTQIPVEVSVRHVVEGPREYLVTVARDLRERLGAEAVLHEHEQRFRQVFDHASDCLFLLELTGEARARFMEVNPAFEELMGVPAAELLGRELERSLPEPAFGPLREQVGACVESGRMLDGELGLTTSSGVRTYHSTLIPVRDGDGRLRRIVGIARDVSARREAEKQRLLRLHRVESTDRINRAIQGARDLDQLMVDTLDVVLEVFDCDRAYLLYPCDPESAEWCVPMERTRPQYPGVLALGAQVPMDDDVAGSLRIMLAADGPVQFGPGAPRPQVDSASGRFGIQSFMAMALRPKTGAPWQFGIHQCSHARVWSPEDEQLFEEIGRRLADGLTSLIMFRDLQQSEERFRLIALRSPDVIATQDLALRYTWMVNPMPPLRLEDVLGATDWNLVPPEDARHLTAIKRGVIETGTSHHEELPLHLGGELRWFDAYFQPLLGSAGERTGISWYARDITERRRTEEVLASSEAKYRSLFEESFDGLFLTSLDGRILDMNKKGISILGYSTKDEVQRLDLAREVYADPADRPRILALVQAQESAEYDVLLKRRDGERVTAHCAMTAVRDDGGEVVAFRGILRDVTEQKQAEESLRKLSRAVEQSPTTIVITDREGTIEYVNPRFTQTTGYQRDEAIGQNPRILKSGETPEAQYRLMWDTIRSGREWHGEFHNRRKDGSLYWERIAISPIFDATGAITHFVALKEDITQHRRLEEEFRQAQRMKAFGQLASGVAHDFNNILTVIQGNAALLQMGETDAAARMATLDQIIAAVERASRLTRQLLLFSRRQVVQPRELDLNAVVANMTTMLQRLIGEHIVLEARYAPGGAPVHADLGMLEQVLMNLAVNARDAMPKGGRLLIEAANVSVDEGAASARPGIQAGEFVRLSVGDTGCGIEPDHLGHIFEPFFTTKDIGRGTGLGLATVFGIVEQHRGWIEVESQVGRGSVFHVHLPRAGRDDIGVAEHRTLARERGGKETLLIVEDEAPLRALLKAVLERQGYRVFEASSGVEAIEVWRPHRDEIDLVLTDMVMPEGVSGWELGRRLQEEKPGLTVLYTTGYTDEMLGEAAVLRGAPNLLEKPYDPVDVLRRVRDCLDRR